MIRSFAVALLLFAASPAYADVIELKTGQRIDGTFKGANDSSVKIEVGGQTVTFKPEQVRAIYYGSAPSATGVLSTDPASAALDALRALHSVVSAGVAYRDYGPRVADAKIRVDPFVNADDSRTALKQAVEDAMGLYIFHGAAWSAEVTRAGVAAYSALGANPLIEKCPILKTAMTELDNFGRVIQRDLLTRGIQVNTNKSALWSCASDKLAETEKLLGK